MAKWVLPEGRKPLPDEWFAERAQMQERIRELEAKLGLAVKRLDKIQSGYYGRAAAIARTTLAELTGGKDE